MVELVGRNISGGSRKRKVGMSTEDCAGLVSGRRLGSSNIMDGVIVEGDEKSCLVVEGG